MAVDSEPEVRRIVASRLSGDDVVPLLQDPDWTVRLEAVANAPLAALDSMTEEDDEEVLALLARRHSQP